MLRIMEERNISHLSTTPPAISHSYAGMIDLALTVYKIVNMKFPDDVQQGRVSFVGFDGMPSMEELKEALKHRDRAATARVDFDKMVETAIDWLRNGSISYQRVSPADVC